MTNRPEAIYTALSPGSYTLRIQAASTAVYWSRSVYSLIITINPPWWRSGWGYLSYVLFSTARLWMFVRHYSQQVQHTKAGLESAWAEEEMVVVRKDWPLNIKRSLQR